MFSLSNKTHPGFIYGGFLVGFLSLFLVLITHASSPDQQILGTWKEVSWEYEKGYDPLRPGEAIADTIQQKIARNRIIHQAETWQFLPDGTLKLAGKPDHSRTALWTLKGRGHVLFMQYDQQTTESYAIASLTPDELVLHFHTDMQIRGIAKITFKKIQ